MGTIPLNFGTQGGFSNPWSDEWTARRAQQQQDYQNQYATDQAAREANQAANRAAESRQGIQSGFGITSPAGTSNIRAMPASDQQGAMQSFQNRMMASGPREVDPRDSWGRQFAGGTPGFYGPSSMNQMDAAKAAQAGWQKSLQPQPQQPALPPGQSINPATGGKSINPTMGGFSPESQARLQAAAVPQKQIAPGPSSASMGPAQAGGPQPPQPGPSPMQRWGQGQMGMMYQRRRRPGQGSIPLNGTGQRGIYGM